MTSLRNVPVDVASTRILNYLRTHNYDDCALYMNRLNPSTFRKILITDLSIDTLLAQLPFSIEIIEVIYSKLFITDPDTFPFQILKPERLISKMISIYASLTLSIHDNASSLKSKEQIIDDEHILSNFASILRIISYIKPILFKRLLRQKETIDECILHFEQHHSTVTNISTLKRSASLTHINLKETLCEELESTIAGCQQALHKLVTKTIIIPEASSSTHSTPALRKKTNTMHPSTSAVSSIATAAIIRNSLDDIQNRLYQHKAILNLIEPYLARSKLFTIMNNLTSKVSIDKKILLAYSHIKTHEKQMPLSEPLLPLFKRFAFAYERTKKISREFGNSPIRCVYSTILGIIQLWRRVTDSTLIDECTDDMVVDDTTVHGGVSSLGGICFERTLSRK
ncbi:unnamed protein product [Rotaria magnacalcarata]